MNGFHFTTLGSNLLDSIQEMDLKIRLQRLKMLSLKQKQKKKEFKLTIHMIYLFRKM